jgi:hypothetical protein
MAHRKRLIEVSNAGLRLREPVIGDELDLMTYGRPSSTVEEPHRVQAAPRKRKSRQAAASAPKLERKPLAAHRTAPVYDSGRTRIDADGVRTVKIKGQATPARRRSQSLYERPMARYDAHPDRAAQWALFLGVFMVVVAIVTGT